MGVKKMRFLLNLLIGGLAVFVSAYILPGVRVDSFLIAIIVSVILGAVNAFIRPVLVLLTLPVTVLTLGLFIFVINAALVSLVAMVVPGFKVDSFWTALLFSFVLSAINWFLHAIA